MRGIRIKNAVCVCLLLIPVITFITGYLSFHLDVRILHAFEPVGHPYISQSLQHNQDNSHSSKQSSFQAPLRMEIKSKQKPEIPKRKHVLINSYMNSGSRFTASMFGFRSDSFYFYEPLWRFTVWDYFHRPNLACSSIRYEGCKAKRPDEANIYRERGRISKVLQNTTMYPDVTHMMSDILNKIYHCQFTGLSNLFVQSVQDDYGGPGWQSYKGCIRTRGRTPKEQCISAQEKSCKTAKHVITKVLRLTTDSLEQLMLMNEDITVIHLFRDPRAIVHSRMETKGYVVHDPAPNAKALCNKMLLDYQGGLRLMDKFPGRFKFVFYEDIKSDVEGTIRKLYQFVGMNFNVPEFKLLNKVKLNNPVNKDPMMYQKRANDNAHWWRQFMSMSRYRSIEAHCGEVMKAFNLTSFKNRHEMVNMSMPSMTLPALLKV